MRIRFLVSIASSEDWAYAVGEVADVPDERATAFVAGGIAEPVIAESAPTPEAAAFSGAAEQAVAPPPRGRKKQS